jgi:hypothetical protein
MEDCLPFLVSDSMNLEVLVGASRAAVVPLVRG